MILAFLACLSPSSFEESPPVSLARSAETVTPVAGTPKKLIPTTDGCAVVTDENEIYQAYPDGTGTWLADLPESVALTETTAPAPAQSEMPFMCQSDAHYGLAPVNTGDAVIRQAVTNFRGYHQEQQIIATIFNPPESPTDWDCLWLDHMDSQVELPVAAWGDTAFCVAAKSYVGIEPVSILFYE